MIRRARSLSVLIVLGAGVLALIASTQTWFHVSLIEASTADLTVQGSAALALLTPLSLAALALGLALSIVGTGVRYVLGFIASCAGIVMLVQNVPLMFEAPMSALAATVSEATGISGDASIAALIEQATPTLWPAVAVIAWLLLFAGGVLVLLTASKWPAAGRKYSSGAARVASDGPLDAVDSWDNLSRGTDPTD